MKKNIPIAQKDSLGCGVACVAFILGFNYQKTLNLFKKARQKANGQGFYCKELAGVLSGHGRNFEYRYIKGKTKKKIYQNNVIVFIRRSKKYPLGHYLCRYKKLWMDPWNNFPKNKNIKEAKVGFRKKLPGQPIYAIIPRQN